MATFSVTSPTEVILSVNALRLIIFYGDYMAMGSVTICNSILR